MPEITWTPDLSGGCYSHVTGYSIQKDGDKYRTFHKRPVRTLVVDHFVWHVIGVPLSGPSFGTLEEAKQYFERLAS